jgi:4'-phosphopantetheinyl transferase
MSAQTLPAQSEAVDLSLCRLDLDDDIALDVALALLSPAERDRAGRFRFARDRERFVRGRGHMRRTLAQMTGINPATLVLEAGERGKPRLSPMFDQATPHFNLSHSGGLAVLAVSWEGPLGIDLEFRDRRLDPARLAPTVLVASERRALECSESGEVLAKFLAMWTAKEARMKLTGEGMALDPRLIELRLDQGWPTGYRLPIGPALRLDFPDIGRPDAICALARFADPAGSGAA